MQQIKQLLNNLYGKQDIIKHRFLITLARLDLYRFEEKRLGRRPKMPGPTK